MKNTSRLFVATLLLTSFANSALADVKSTNGQAVLIPRPADAQLNAPDLVSNTTAYVWNEVQNVQLASSVTIDASAPGVYNSESTLKFGSIASGTVVSSHMIHFNSVKNTDQTIFGEVTFDRKIVGVIAWNRPGSRHLDSSDSALGMGTLYTHNNDYRGVFEGKDKDNFSILGSGQKLAFHLSVSLPYDEVRVLTEAGPTLHIDNTKKIVQSHIFGQPSTDTIVRSISNIGSALTTLQWNVAELANATWLSESPNSGSIAFGASPTPVQLTFDPFGLPLGPYKTRLRFQNTGVLADMVDVDVLYVIENGTVVPFVAGDTLSGSVDFEGESDLASFTALKGTTLQIGVAITSGDLKPIVTLLDANNNEAKPPYKFKNSTKAVKKTFSIPADGNYKIKISGEGSTSGSYSITTKATLPKDAKSITKKNAGPKVDGEPVDYKVRLLTGATLTVTVQPTTNFTGPIAIALLDSQNAAIDVSGFTQLFGTGGIQCSAIPITSTGQFTVRVTGLATKKEKATITITLNQPVGTGVVLLQ